MGYLAPIPTIILFFALALLVVAPFSFLAGRRGGRYRALPGWIGFWSFFAALLVVLSRAHAWAAAPVLAVLMFIGLRRYFFVTPMRAQDRWAIAVAYLAVPVAVVPAFSQEAPMVGAALPVLLFLIIPVLLARGPASAGLLDSMGRVLFGILVFIFCAAHLALQAHEPEGRLELFGILTLMGELPQRLLGRPGSGAGWVRILGGFVSSAGVAGALGWALGPMAAVPRPSGVLAALLIVTAVAAGHLVAAAVAADLDMGASDKVVGRAAFLDRVIPALYAAPVYYHVLRVVL